MISFDWPWWDWDQESSVDQTLLANIDFLLPSIEELTVHADAAFKAEGAGSTRDGNVFEAGRRLLAFGPRGIGVKMGARGMRFLLRDGERWHQIPPYPAQVVDPTGAGDAFCGGFLVGLARTGDPLQACLYGAVSASFIIEEFGVLHALEVDAAAGQSRLKRLQDIFLNQN